jgi:hypothetical protein
MGNSTVPIATLEMNETTFAASSMVSVSPEIVPVLVIFQNAFTAPTWEKAQALIVGTLFVTGLTPCIPIIGSVFPATTA